MYNQQEKKKRTKNKTPMSEQEKRQNGAKAAKRHRDKKAADFKLLQVDCKLLKAEVFRLTEENDKLRQKPTRTEFGNGTEHGPYISSGKTSVVPNGSGAAQSSDQTLAAHTHGVLDKNDVPPAYDSQFGSSTAGSNDSEEPCAKRYRCSPATEEDVAPPPHRTSSTTKRSTRTPPPHKVTSTLRTSGTVPTTPDEEPQTKEESEDDQTTTPDALTTTADDTTTTADDTTPTADDQSTADDLGVEDEVRGEVIPEDDQTIPGELITQQGGTVVTKVVVDERVKVATQNQVEDYMTNATEVEGRKAKQFYHEELTRPLTTHCTQRRTQQNTHQTQMGWSLAYDLEEEGQFLLIIHQAR